MRIKMSEQQPEEKQPEPKPVDVKKHVQALVTALKHAETINRYDVMEKSYPAELGLFFNKGKDRLTNPTLVSYIARAEKKVVETRIRDVIEIAADMINNDLQEIRGILG